MFKSNKNQPKNHGMLWTENEEIKLLEELEQKIDINTIALNHERTTGGINKRLQEIAYKMHLNNITIDEIINKTTLTSDIINETIERKKIIKCKNNNRSSEKEIIPELLKEIDALKTKINILNLECNQKIELIKKDTDFLLIQKDNESKISLIQLELDIYKKLYDK